MATAVASVSAACDYIDGNYYCAQTNKIIYENVGFSGSYLDITNMDETTGVCTLSSLSFLGSLAPLDEELSLHFRGPLKLLQFGVYYPAASSKAKRDEEEEEEDCSTTQHVHHKHVKRALAYVTKTVYVDQHGNTLTTTTTTTSTPSTAGIVGSGNSPSVGGAPLGVSSGVVTASLSSSSSSSTKATSASSASSSSTAAAGDWVRVSYYTPGLANNCTFLNHYGGSGSGVWSSTFGNSLSYANSDNSGASSSAVALGDVTIGSNSEFVVMSGLKCGDSSETGSCGYYRTGTPAFHGWNGNQKIFVFEFKMPSTSDTGTNGDMPAVWMLNAKIPRTLQYGTASCSCWTTGCGELDLFEILSTGSNKLITHLHDKQGASGASGYGGGGSSDYFTRPTTGTLKAAVIFTEKEIHIQTVDEDFDSVLSSSTVQAWIDQTGSTVSISS